MILSGLIGGAVSVIVAIVAGRANVKAAGTANEGIYAKELPDLLEQIKQLNIERSQLSRQLLEMQHDNVKLRGTVDDLKLEVGRLTDVLKRNGVNQ